MKTKLIAIPFLVIAAVVTSACTTAQPTASIPPNDPRQGASLPKRSYTQEELQKRGRTTTGEALAAQDASVTISGR